MPVEDRRRERSKLWEHVVHPERRPHGIRLLIAVAILVLAALPVERDEVSAFELDVFRWLNELPGALEPALQTVMQLGSLFAIPMVAAMAWVQSRRIRRGIDLFLAGTLAWGAARLIKELVQRGRPDALLHDVVLRGDAATGFGFVSGHAAVAAALATVAAFYLPMRGKVLVWVLALLVGVARIYVGVHLPLDVAGGLAMGWAIGSVVHFVLLPELTGAPAEAEGT
ncbi:MAG TPA: phosphatase PAP2 family protein [Actinomycetota bacterium]